MATQWCGPCSFCGRTGLYSHPLSLCDHCWHSASDITDPTSLKDCQRCRVDSNVRPKYKTVHTVNPGYREAHIQIVSVFDHGKVPYARVFWGLVIVLVVLLRT